MADSNEDPLDLGPDFHMVKSMGDLQPFSLAEINSRGVHQFLSVLDTPLRHSDAHLLAHGTGKGVVRCTICRRFRSIPITAVVEKGGRVRHVFRMHSVKQHIRRLHPHVAVILGIGAHPNKDLCEIFDLRLMRALLLCGSSPSLLTSPFFHHAVGALVPGSAYRPLQSAHQVRELVSSQFASLMAARVYLVPNRSQSCVVVRRGVIAGQPVMLVALSSVAFDPVPTRVLRPLELVFLSGDDTHDVIGLVSLLRELTTDCDEGPRTVAGVALSDGCSFGLVSKVMPPRGGLRLVPCPVEKLRRAVDAAFASCLLDGCAVSVALARLRDASASIPGLGLTRIEDIGRYVQRGLNRQELPVDPVLLGPSWDALLSLPRGDVEGVVGLLCAVHAVLDRLSSPASTLSWVVAEVEGLRSYTLRVCASDEEYQPSAVFAHALRQNLWAAFPSDAWQAACLLAWLLDPTQAHSPPHLASQLEQARFVLSSAAAQVGIDNEVSLGGQERMRGSLPFAGHGDTLASAVAALHTTQGPDAMRYIPDPRYPQPSVSVSGLQPHTQIHGMVDTYLTAAGNGVLASGISCEEWWGVHRTDEAVCHLFPLAVFYMSCPASVCSLDSVLARAEALGLVHGQGSGGLSRLELRAAILSDALGPEILALQGGRNDPSGDTGIRVQDQSSDDESDQDSDYFERGRDTITYSTAPENTHSGTEGSQTHPSLLTLNTVRGTGLPPAALVLNMARPEVSTTPHHGVTTE
ncbi:hypothetical protein KIPB_007052 [Kipferlia bialata]|uniref:Uncharacterized protein n=1 Tax=Kipferlia bialata TaxID=797122 RepID=A0A9K3CXY2_9EUKA|nr:hypothetical protein KIPB_007052 [Kipferlia bialata]|eukprot:g7052.t1